LVSIERRRASDAAGTPASRIVLFRDFADPRFLEDVIGEPRPGS
jgi:hypothetical protein